jgi:hypothetical protein
MDRDRLRSEYRQALLDALHGKISRRGLEDRFRSLGLSDKVMAAIRKEVQIELLSDQPKDAA